MLEIRPAEDVDHEKIIRLWHQGWHEAHAGIAPPEVLPFRSERHFAIWLEEARDAFYVAFDGAELLGFVSVKEAEVVKLYVGRAARGTGAAQALLSFAEQLLYKNGVSRAELFCVEGNSRAERFYEKSGWSLSHSFEGALWVPKGVTLQFMARTLRFQKDLTSVT